MVETSKEATVVIDLGNSQNRAIVETGNFKGSTRKSKLIVLDNRVSRMAMFRAYRYNAEDYNADNSTVFRLEDASINGKAVKGTIAGGKIAEKEFSSTFKSPDVKTPKYKNSYTLFNTIRVLFSTVKYLQTLEGNEDKSYEDIVAEYKFNLSILLPPEQAEAQKTLVEDLKGIPTVHFELPKVDLKFNIEQVLIQQEGFTAFFGVFFDRRSKAPRKNLENAVTKRVLVIDVGEGTTDLMLMDNMTALESSKRTLNLGGANVLSEVRRNYEMDNHTSYNRNSFMQAVLTGKLVTGNHEKDITDYINDAKYNVAYQIVSEIQDYFLSSNLDAETINYVMVVGGGTLDSENEEINSLGEEIGKSFQEYAPDTDIINVNTLDTNERLVGTDDMFNSRTANVIGASIITDMRDMNEEKYMSEEE